MDSSHFLVCEIISLFLLAHYLLSLITEAKDSILKILIYLESQVQYPPNKHCSTVLH